MRKPSRVAVPELSAQNEGVATEVGIEELKANLSRFLQLVQAGNEVLIKDGDTVVARLVHPQREPA